MRVVLDTNVVISGIFFRGAPWRILAAWREGRFSLVVSPAILEEYRRVAEQFAVSFPSVNISSILDLITVHAEIVDDRPSPVPASRDPDDDKFLVCAAASGACVVSGDKDLLSADGVLGVRVYSTRAFIAEFLT